MTHAISFIILAGCAAFAAVPAAAQAPRTIDAIHTATAPPLGFIAADGSSQGIMVDVCKAVAADNGWNITFRTVVFADIVTIMGAGGADFVCAAFSYSPQRLAAMAFAPPIVERGEGLAVAASDMTAYQSMSDLTAVPVGTVTGTNYIAQLAAAGVASPQLYPSNAAGLDALRAGQIKVFVSLEPALDWLIAQSYPELKVVDSYETGVIATYGIGVRNDDPALLAAVNASLAKLAFDGTIRGILEEWDR